MSRDVGNAQASATALSGPVLTAGSPLQPVSDAYPRMRSRWIIDPNPAGWDDVVLSEWELIAAGFVDLHPHDETNIIVAGELYVESAGTTVVARPGDTVRVIAGTIGKYWAPKHARMIGVYGPNPTGADSEYLEYWEIGDDGEGQSK